MKTAACYIRVSTDDQLEYSPDAQLKEIKKYASAHDLFIDDKHIFVDEGISGRNTKKRDAFNRMIAMAKGSPKPFDVVLLWKFSRFARSREDSIVYKAMLRKQCEIDVISITEDVGDDKMSILIEALIEAMDEYYSINLAEEVKRGMTEKATRGGIQAAASFGYAKKPGESMVVLEEEAKYVRYVFEQYLTGKSMFAIASNLNSLGVKTKRGNPFENRQIEYMINNPVYKGCARWTPAGKTVSKRIYDSPDTLVVKSTHPAIIPEVMWNLANEKYKEQRLRRKKNDRPADTKKHYLSGILKCGSCGATLSFAQATEGFQCINYAHGSCKPSHYISAAKIEAAILQKLAELSRPASYIPNVRMLSVKIDERDLLLADLASLERMMDRVKQAYLSGLDTIEEYEANKKKVQKEINLLQGKIDLMDAEPTPVFDQKLLKGQIEDILSILGGKSPVSEKHSALKKIVEKIVFSRPDETVSIFFYA